MVIPSNHPDYPIGSKTLIFLFHRAQFSHVCRIRLLKSHIKTNTFFSSLQLKNIFTKILRCSFRKLMKINGCKCLNVIKRCHDTKLFEAIYDSDVEKVKQFIEKVGFHKNLLDNS